MFILLVLGIVTDVGSGGHELQHSQAMGSLQLPELAHCVLE